MKVVKWFEAEEIINNLEEFGKKLAEEKLNPLKDFNVFLKAFVEVYNTLIQGEEEDEDLKGFALNIQDDLEENGESVIYFSVQGGEKLVMAAEFEEFKLGIWEGAYAPVKDEQSLCVEFNQEGAHLLIYGDTDLEQSVHEGNITLNGVNSLLSLLEMWFDDFFGLLEGGSEDGEDSEESE